MSAPEWLVIDGAPKGDGFDMGPAIFACAIRPGQTGVPCPSAIRWNPEGFWEEAWSSKSENGYPVFRRVAIEPTHWFPIPTVPK